MWDDLVYTKAQAKFKFQQVEAQPENCAPRKVKTNFGHLREVILQEKQTFLSDETKKINSYAFDLHLGLVLYELLNNEYHFNERLAAQDEVWRFLSLEIFPDVVYERFGINDERFYKKTRRIWLKVIWWYIHLSWQGTVEQTYDILKDNSADEIIQLIDRSGSGGYRIAFTRELMRQHHSFDRKSSKLFRRILKLNTARLNMIEPSLVEGGIEAYVADLYNYFKQETLVKA